jgi:hypothetical protein
MRLLAHVTYYDSNVTAGVSSRTSALKTSSSWRDFCFNAVVRTLSEMVDSYEMFRAVDVVVDVNEQNQYQQRLRAWISNHTHRRHHLAEPSRRVRVMIAAHQLSHPFRLAWVHREHMATRLSQYDWFMSVEGDTLVPAVAMATQVAIAPPLYARHGLLLGFTRVVNDTSGRSFFSDIVKPAAKGDVVEFDGLGKFVTPTNTYAAVWAYPSAVMRPFTESEDWMPRLRSTRGMRERAAWGWRHGKIVTLVDSSTLRIYHVGKSGPFLVRERGHNSWPAEKLVAT